MTAAVPTSVHAKSRSRDFDFFARCEKQQRVSHPPPPAEALQPLPCQSFVSCAASRAPSTLSRLRRKTVELFVRWLMANSLQSGCIADEAPSRARNQLASLERYNARRIGTQLGTYAYRYRTHSATSMWRSDTWTSPFCEPRLRWSLHVFGARETYITKCLPGQQRLTLRP